MITNIIISVWNVISCIISWIVFAPIKFINLLRRLFVPTKRIRKIRK